MILVTGGSGLVGSHLLYYLLKQHDTVKAICRRSSDLEAVKTVFSYYGDDYLKIFAKVRWLEVDLLDISSLESAFEGITKVYHCAALISFDSADYQKMRRVNIEGTTNIVNLCIEYNVEKLCFVSSVAAIENKAEEEIIDESDNWNSNTDKSGYAITKYGAELEVWRCSQEGIPVVVVNPGVILGSGQWSKGSSNLFNRVDKGLPFYTEGVTGFVGVQDVVRIMILLMDSEIKNERYILVSQNLSFRELLFNIAEELKKKKPRIRIGKGLSEFIWRFEFFKSKILLSSPLLTKYTARSSISKHPYSSEKIEKTLNYNFEKISDCVKRISLNFRKL